MSALSSGSGTAARLSPEKPPEKPKTRGFLHIVRHGGGPNAIYIVTYHRLDHEGPSPALGVGPHPKPVDLRLSEARGALEDILRLGSANIPDLWLSDEEMIEKGLVEG